MLVGWSAMQSCTPQEPRPSIGRRLLPPTAAEDSDGEAKHTQNGRAFRQLRMHDDDQIETITLVAPSRSRSISAASRQQQLERHLVGVNPAYFSRPRSQSLHGSGPSIRRGGSCVSVSQSTCHAQSVEQQGDRSDGIVVVDRRRRRNSSVAPADSVQQFPRLQIVEVVDDDNEASIPRGPSPGLMSALGSLEEDRRERAATATGPGLNSSIQRGGSCLSQRNALDKERLEPGPSAGPGGPQRHAGLVSTPRTGRPPSTPQTLKPLAGHQLLSPRHPAPVSASAESLSPSSPTLCDVEVAEISPSYAADVPAGKAGSEADGMRHHHTEEWVNAQRRGPNTQPQSNHRSSVESAPNSSRQPSVVAEMMDEVVPAPASPPPVLPSSWRPQSQAPLPRQLHSSSQPQQQPTLPPQLQPPPQVLLPYRAVPVVVQAIPVQTVERSAVAIVAGHTILPATPLVADASALRPSAIDTVLGASPRPHPATNDPNSSQNAGYRPGLTARSERLRVLEEAAAVEKELLALQKSDAGSCQTLSTAFHQMPSTTASIAGSMHQTATVAAEAAAPVASAVSAAAPEVASFCRQAPAVGDDAASLQTDQDSRRSLQRADGAGTFRDLLRRVAATASSTASSAAATPAVSPIKPSHNVSSASVRAAGGSASVTEHEHPAKKIPAPNLAAHREASDAVVHRSMTRLQVLAASEGLAPDSPAERQHPRATEASTLMDCMRRAYNARQQRDNQTAFQRSNAPEGAPIDSSTSPSVAEAVASSAPTDSGWVSPQSRAATDHGVGKPVWIDSCADGGPPALLTLTNSSHRQSSSVGLFGVSGGWPTKAVAAKSAAVPIRGVLQSLKHRQPAPWNSIPTILTADAPHRQSSVEGHTAGRWEAKASQQQHSPPKVDKVYSQARALRPHTRVLLSTLIRGDRDMSGSASLAAIADAANSILASCGSPKHHHCIATSPPSPAGRRGSLVITEDDVRAMLVRTGEAAGATMGRPRDCVAYAAFVSSVVELSS